MPPITIGGILYPSREFYQKNVIGQGKEAIGGREVPIQQNRPSSTKALQDIESQLVSIRKQVPSISAGIKDISSRDVVTPEELEGGGVEEGRPGTPRGFEDTLSELIAASRGSSQSFEKLSQEYKALLEQSRNALDEARTKQKGLLESLVKKQEDRPTTEELRSRAFQALGLPEGFTAQQFNLLQTTQGEIIALNDEMNILRTQEQNIMANNSQQAIPQGSVNVQNREVERRFAIKKSSLAAEIGVKTMQAQMYQGNVQLAEGLVGKIVTTLLYETNQEIEDLRYMFDIRSDIVDDLESEERKWMDNMLGLLEKKEKVERQDYTAKLNILLDAYKDGIIPNVSASEVKSMSLEEIIGRVGEQVAKAQAISGELTTETIGGFEVLKEGGKRVTQRVAGDDAPVGVPEPEPDEGFALGTIAFADEILNNPDFGLENVPAANREEVQTFLFTNMIQQESRDVETLGRKLNALVNLGQSIRLFPDEIRMMVFDDFENNTSFEEVLRAIQSLPITNKSEAEEIAREVYGISPTPEEIQLVPGLFTPDRPFTPASPDTVRDEPLPAPEKNLKTLFSPITSVFESINFPSLFRF